jgi:single-strand DNA-binding protein
VASSYRTRTPEGAWQDKTEWVRVTVFGARADSLSQYLKKGTRVFVDGRLEARPWTDREGQVRAGLEIVASDVEFMSSQRGPTVTWDEDDLPARASVADERHGPRPRPEVVALGAGGTVGPTADDGLDGLPF